MANRSRTYLSTDWSIQTFVPESGSFILNFSQLDGSDVLGTTSGSYETIDAGIVSLSLNEGGTPVSGLVFELSPTTLVATLRFRDFQMSDINKFYVGAGVRLLLLNENTLADSTYGNSTPIFQGVIDSVNVDLVPGEDFAQLTFTANYFTAELNSLISVYKSTTQSRLDSIDLASPSNANANYFNWPTAPAYAYSTNTTETKSLGDFFTDLVSSDLSIPSVSPWLFWGNESTGQMTYAFTPRFHYNKIGTSVATFTGADLTDIVLGWSGQDAPTGVTLSLYGNETIIYQYGAGDSATDSNTRSYVSMVDVKDLTELTAVGQQLLSMTPEFAPISITTETATQYQEITFREQDDSYSPTTDKSWIVPTTLFDIGNTITVNVAEHGINQAMLITGRTLEINPDNWMTTYNLWKGL